MDPPIGKPTGMSPRPGSSSDTPASASPSAAQRQTEGEAKTEDYGSSAQTPSWLSEHRSQSNIDTSHRVFPIRSVISSRQPVSPSGDANESISRRDVAASYGQSRQASYSYGNPSDSPQRGPESEPTQETRSDMESSVERPRKPYTRPRGRAGPASSAEADAERYGASGPVLQFADDSSADSESTAPVPETTVGPQQTSSGTVGEAYLTTRFKHVVTEEGHAVITGRDGTLQRCEDEPIHTPGAVQAFGVLIALREEEEGKFVARYISENSYEIIGHTPQDLFRLDNFLSILSDEQADKLLDHIDFVRDEDADPAVNGPEVFGLSVRSASMVSIKVWCAIHINLAHPDLVICEFERDNDTLYPLRPVDEDIPAFPEDTLKANPTMEELAESTEVLSRPLRVPRSARRGKGEAGAMQVFDIMSQIQEQLSAAPNLERFLKVLVGIVKELTGFHRVMIYQFDSSFNGKVVTELVDSSQTVDLYKGLHFPATDIPKQARELYRINKVRLLYDRDLESARLVCKSTEDLETALDMTHAYLRAMSPIHLKYLANMAVRSSMSISINAFNQLWGLIACHSYGPKGMRVSFPVRKMCRLIGETASRNIERLSYASRLQARKLINTAPTDKNPSGYITASSEDLLTLFKADFGILSIEEEAKILGKISQSQEAIAILEYLRMRKFTSVVITQDIREEFPDLNYPMGFTMIAGLLYVPLSIGGNDFIVFFRKGQVKDVKWAGNPYEKIVREGTAGYLEPRTSFKVWHETVVGKCREWSEEEIETAAVLCLVYGKFIQVWRQKEAALESSRLTRLLLANSAHEVRTPLNAIINYLEVALEGALDAETRDNLAKSHSASKSLIYVINDLLDLAKAEEGQKVVKNELFDLLACIQEATEPFKVDAKRKGIEYEVVEHPNVPRHVYGDSRRVRQAVANITANAVQYTDKGRIRVEITVAEIVNGQALIEIIVKDTGRGMSSVQLDGLFRDLEQVSSDSQESPADQAKDEKEVKPRTLGLGLAMVARLARNMNGQLRLRSELEKGSRFVLQLPFKLQGADEPEVVHGPGAEPALPDSGAPAASAPSPPRTAHGEVTLVGDSQGLTASRRPSADPREAHDPVAQPRRSQSGGSGRSSRSDADRLINAIQSPLSIGEKEVQSAKGAAAAGLITGSPEPIEVRADGVERATVAAQPMPPGIEPLLYERVPLRAVRMPDADEYVDQSSRDAKAIAKDDLDEPPSMPLLPQRGPKSVVSEAGQSAATTTDSTASGSSAAASRVRRERLQVLVAEDDPINMRILSKRLDKAGYSVRQTVNGMDCATVYGEEPETFDVILMDMQVSRGWE